jgi:hypothetical protein
MQLQESPVGIQVFAQSTSVFVTWFSPLKLPTSFMHEDHQSSPRSPYLDWT